MFKRFLCGLLVAATIITSLPGNYVSSAAEIDTATVIENVATEGEDSTAEFAEEITTGDSESETEEETIAEETTEENVEEANKKVAEKPSEEASEETNALEETNPSFGKLYYEEFHDSDKYWRKSTAERYLYDENAKDLIGQVYYGETVEEVLSMLEDEEFDMAPLEKFFEGTTFANDTKEDLEYYAENNISFNMIIQAKVEYLKQKEEDKKGGFTKFLKEFIKNFATDADAEVVVNSSEGTAYKTGNARSNNITGITIPSKRFVAPVLGTSTNALFAYQTLNGEPSFCADFGKSFRAGDTDYSVISGSVPSYVAQAVNYYKDDSNSSSYEYAQMYIWAGGDKTKFERAFKEYCCSAGYEGPRKSYDEIAAMSDSELTSSMSHAQLNFLSSVYSRITSASTSNSGIKLWSNGSSTWQRLYSPAEDTVEDEYAVDVYFTGYNDGVRDKDFTQSIDVNKYSSFNNESLSGAEFKVEVSNTGSSILYDSSIKKINVVNGTGNQVFSFKTPEASTYITHPSSKEYSYTFYDTDPHLGFSGEQYEATYNRIYNELQEAGNADLETKLNNLVANASIQYKITETKAPDNFILNSTPQYVTINGAGSSATLTGDNTFYDEPIHTGLIVKKVDNIFYSMIYRDAEFTIYEYNSASDSYQASNYKFIRNSNGEYVSADNSGNQSPLYYTLSNKGKFKVVETKAPFGFFGDFKDSLARTEKNEYFITLTPAINGQDVWLTNSGFSTSAGTLTNKEVKGTLKFFKVDKDANAYVSDNGNANLDGAIYDVYAAENILACDNATIAGFNGHIYNSDTDTWEDRHVSLNKDTLITSGVIENGSFKVEGLPLGKYYVKERCKKTNALGNISYAEGYLVDENTYNFEIKYTNENYLTEVVTSNLDNEQYPANAHVSIGNVISKDEVIKSGFKLTKLTQNTGETMMRPLANAGFSIYKISDLSKINEFTKDASGKYNLDSIINAYENKNYSNTVLKFDFTGENRAYTYKDGARVEFPEVFSNSEGIVEVNDLPYGEYLVVETTTPADVFTVDPFIVSVDENSKPVQDMRYLDDEGFEAFLKISKIDAETGKEVLKANTAFEIIDKKTDERVVMTDTISGELPRIVDIFNTNEEGVLTLPELLPVGDYTIKEVVAPEGFYNNTTVDNFVVDFSVTTNRVYEAVGTDLSTNRDVIKIAETFENHETLGILTLYKEGNVIVGKHTPDEDNPDCFRYEKKYLPGAKFEIYADGDVFTQDNQDTTWFNDGELVATVTTGEDGQIDETVFPPAHTSTDNFLKSYHDGTEGKVSIVLPLGNYIIKEVKTVHGYVLDNETEYKVSFEWDNQNDKYVEKELKVFNERQRLELKVTKKDSEDDTPIAGAKFRLYSDGIFNKGGTINYLQGETICEAVSDENGVVIFDVGLPPKNDINTGKYYIEEVEAPEGYLLNSTPCVFEYIYNDPTTKVVKMSDECIEEKTSVKINKLDADGEFVEGATLVLKDATDYVYDEWVTTDETHVIKGLPLNKCYILSEKEPAKGYVTAPNIVFTLIQENDKSVLIDADDNHVENVVDMVDDYTKLSVSKKDLVNGKEIAGAKLSIINSDGEVVESWTSGCDGLDENGEVIPHMIEYLEIGEYTLREVLPPTGYKISNDIKFSVVDSGEIQKVTMYDAPLDVELRKLDKNTKDFLPGVEFVVTDNKGNVIEEITTGNEAYLFTNLNYSTDDEENIYILKEVNPQSGYTTVSDMKFKIVAIMDENNDYETHVFVYKNDKWVDTGLDYIEIINDITRVEIAKKDITTGENIKGAKLALYDEEGIEVVSWISGTSEVKVGEHLKDYSEYVIPEKVIYKVGEDMVAEKEKNPEKVLATYLEKLPVGKYTLKELVAPIGYKKAEDMEIEILNTNEMQTFVMNDVPMDSQIMLHKVDAADNTKFIEGAEFTIYAGNEIVDVIKTNDKGEAISKELPLARIVDGKFEGFIQYRIVETKAPNNYFVSGEELYVTMEDGNSIYDIGDISNVKKGKTGSGSEDGGRLIKTVKPAPKTGDAVNALLLLLITLTNLIAAATIFFKGKELVVLHNAGKVEKQLSKADEFGFGIRNNNRLKLHWIFKKHKNKGTNEDIVADTDNVDDNNKKKMRYKLKRFFVKPPIMDYGRGNSHKLE